MNATLELAAMAERLGANRQVAHWPGGPDIWLPAGYESFDHQGSVVVPAIASTATVFSRTIATPGWEGLIRRFSINVYGPGLVPGDLIFSMFRDGQPVRGYNSIITELGSLENPRPTDGVQLRPGQVFEIKVSNVGYAALGSTILATVSGMLRPAARRED